MAVITPLLLLLLFGIIESAWAFNQRLDVSHGSQEGARLAAVDFAGGDTAITAEVCDRMSFAGDRTLTSVRISVDGDAIGDTTTVIVESPYQGLTGVLDGFFGGATVSSTVDTRLEQVPGAGLGTGVPLSCPATP